MFIETILDFFKELGFILKKIITSRVIPFVIVALALFSVLVYRLFDLQIVNGEKYTQSYNLKAEKTVVKDGYRGNIYDANGELLAYSELAYSVIIEDCGYYDSTKIKYEALNSIISDMVTIIEEHGDSIDYDFEIDYVNGRYVYNVSDNALLRFLRDIYGHANISELTEEERTAEAKDVVEYLKTRYKINQPAAEGEEPTTVYSDEMVLKIIYIRYNLAANSYKRYIPYKVATNIKDTTMASILENSDKLTGVTIEEDFIRKYNYSTYMAHIIGYTGKINSTELTELSIIDSSYEANDIIGKAGIEAEFETILAGKKGYETILVDNVGRVMEVIETVDATVGSDVYLTIDAKLQEEVYHLLERRLAETLVSRIVNSDTDRVEKNIVIPITAVCAALINNNKIDMELIKTSETEAGMTVYNTFEQKRSLMLMQIESTLNTDTAQNSLPENLNESIRRMRALLIETDIIDAEKINSNEEIQKQWVNGTISFRAYIEGAISLGWVNIHNLDVSNEYPTKDEVISSLIKEGMALLSSDRDFDKMLYNDLIMSHAISNKNICLILMEQGNIDYTESEYVTIQNGGSVYDFLINKIKTLEITPAELALDPSSGACVLEDPNNGNILAMVSYPSYDNNYFSGTIDAKYYASLLDNASTPLVNRVTQTKIAPGSTFKPLIALAALNEGFITPSEVIYCDGVFDTLQPNIKCSVYPNKHEGLNMEFALAQSCNDYFCELGYRLCFDGAGGLDFNLGLSRIQMYAELMGISTPTGIQIPETTPHVTDYSPVASAIGQGTNAYTTLNLARYTSTLANSGTVYNSSIISKIENKITGETTVYEPVVDHIVEFAPETWEAVEIGMNEVLNTAYAPVKAGIPGTCYAKSGTAEENKNRANHACFIYYTKDDEGNPDMVVTTMIPNAYVAVNAAIMCYYAMGAYYDVDLPSQMYHHYATSQFEIID